MMPILTALWVKLLAMLVLVIEVTQTCIWHFHLTVGKQTWRNLHHSFSMWKVFLFFFFSPNVLGKIRENASAMNIYVLTFPTFQSWRQTLDKEKFRTLLFGGSCLSFWKQSSSMNGGNDWVWNEAEVRACATCLETLKLP